MNIFYLAHSPVDCAKHHNDAHVRKMMIEYAQLMSTAHRVLDAGRNDVDHSNLYKCTHQNHPSAKWVRLSRHNYTWLYRMWKGLHEEYLARYGKSHLSWTKLHKALKTPPKNISNAPFTEPPACMPKEYVEDDAVLSYRNYYMSSDKAHIATWKTNRPYWFIKGRMTNVHI